VKRIVIFIIVFIVLSAVLPAEINVYFTHSIDTTLANPHKANGLVALDWKLIDRITSAQYSIDFCFYNIWRWNITDSLIAAYNRGVDVRVITEHDNIGNLAVQNIIDAGIPIIDDTFGNNQGNGFMHNKFAIFDFRDSSSTSDDWLWTGSYNITDYGTESNANNAVEIQHSEISRAYTLEFEEMWGSSSNIPDSSNSRFSYLKTNNTEHNFVVDSIPIELYFSPSDHSTQEICNTIDMADSTIYFCIFAFTRQDVCNSMKTKWDLGISVKGVFDEMDWLDYYSKSRDMTGDPSSSNPWSPPAPVFCDSVSSPWGPELLHHKYMIIDSDFDSDPTTVTGSQNWSNSGELDNDENTLIIHSQDITNQYLQEFVERYREAGGEYVGCDEEKIIMNERTIEIFPNPFTDKVEIKLGMYDVGCKMYDNSIKIYDVSGRLVKNLALGIGHSASGTTLIWDGKDITDKRVKSGVYFIKISGKHIVKVIKIM
jgi:phosphatidylserine/phosphatidylglycerophosphate/cardiolipin synthase-like enzyme